MWKKGTPIPIGENINLYSLNGKHQRVSSKKVRTELPYDLAGSPVGMYAKEIRVLKGHLPLVFIVA